MTEAPERIVASEGMGQRYWSDKMDGGVLRDLPGIAQAEYVLASVADEDRRKLERLAKAAAYQRCHCWPNHALRFERANGGKPISLHGTATDHQPHCRELRAAIAEIEGEEG